MSVVGFDFGNESCVIAVARQRGIDVVLNNESNRETPAIVCFGENQRFIGTAGAASTMTNPKNAISQIKRLIGRQFSDPELQKDILSFPFKVTEGTGGYPLIHASYMGESKTFTPTQVLAMLFSDLKSIAEKNMNAAVGDCCIGIPAYFTDHQRRAVLDAAAIAGLHPLQLIHETTATALAYGLYKTDLPANGQLNVAFIDIGHASLQVCIAGFMKGQLKILAYGYDRNLGGRDFDEVLFQHFAEKCKAEYKIDVSQSPKACLRLRAGCEKLKKVLSVNAEAPLNIECLIDDKDVRGFIKREDFERISDPILKRVKRPLEEALADAKLLVDDVHMVEVVGSGSRVPAVGKILRDFFGKELRHSMNASECVAKGCALQCAILSPAFKVRDFKVNESFPFSIRITWKAADAHNGGTDNQQGDLVFPKGSRIPSLKYVTLPSSNANSVDVQYADIGDLHCPPPKISTYTIGPFQSAKADGATVEVKARLNIHGIVSIDSAMLLEEEDVEISVTKDSVADINKMDSEEASVGAAPSGTNDADVNMEEAKDGPDADAGAKTEKMETDSKAEAPKKKVKKTKIPVEEVIAGGLSPEGLQKAVEEEYKMALQDRVMEETKDKKNAVEAYIYDMRNKLEDQHKYYEFVTNSEREVLLTKLQDDEDWLYEEGEDQAKSIYILKLEELKKRCNPVELRYKEYMEREPVMNQLIYWINRYREAAVSNGPQFDHIDEAERQKVLTECAKAEAWLRNKKLQQDPLPKHANPVLLSADMTKKAEALDRFCRPIMTKPKPKPSKPAAPEAPPRSSPQGSNDHHAHETYEEPMDTDKPDELS